MERDFKVVAKGLKGKNRDTPFVKLVSEYGEKLEIHVPSRLDLAKYHIEEILTIEISQTQQTLPVPEK